MSTEKTFFEVPVGFKARFTLGKFDSDVENICWSPDGKILASGHHRGTIQLWDSQTGELKHSLKGFSNILSITWSPDGFTLVSSESTRGVCFWDLQTGGLKGTIEFRYDKAIKIAWSPDGQVLAMLMSDNTVSFYYKPTGKTGRIAGTSNDLIKSFVWSRNGDSIAIGYANGNIIIIDTHTKKIIHTLSGHSDAVLGLAWSPDGNTIASCSKDRTVRLWSLLENQSTILEGHTSQVNSVAFSFDGQLLASKSSDRNIWFWRCDLAMKVTSLREITQQKDESFLGVSFHPNESTLALTDASKREIFIWDFNQTILLNLASSDPSFRYANAKVVLVGNSGVGKSGLGLALSGQPFVATESTHGRHVWVFDTYEVDTDEGLKETREILLWDLAGQPGYRLIHQLHLNEVALALVVFDVRSETDPFSGVRHWDRALRQANRIQGSNKPPIKKFLVAARSDRGGVGVSSTRIESLKNDLGFDAYFETSAKEGWNIPQLSEAIKRMIAWDKLPKVISTGLFQHIKSFLIEEKQAGRVLSTITGLFRTFLKSNINIEASNELLAQFETCIGRVESRGLIRRLSFGNLVLLQPELLDAYASAIVNAAKDEPDGLGSIAEEDILAGRFRMSKEERIDDREQERLLLIATMEEMLLHEVTLREQAIDGPYLVFPSQLTRENPDLPDPQGKALTFGFEGPVQNIYATLVVRLSHSGFFKKLEMWKNAATFKAGISGINGIYLKEIDEGRAELTLFFESDVSKETRYHFEEFIHSHLLRRALPETITKRLVIVCPDCGFIVTDQLVELRARRGFDWLNCPACNEKLSLREPHEILKASGSSVVLDLDRAADNQRDLDAGLVSAAGEMRTESFRKWAGATSTTLAIVFTDIVGSTDLVNQIGNEAMNRVRRSHFNQGQQLINKYGGYKIKTIGDSIMIAFRTVLDALDFILEFRLDTGDANIKIRAGVHVGPVYIEDEDAFGSMVNYAARVVGFAKGPELWVSNSAKDHIDQDKAERHAKITWYEYPGCYLKGFTGRHKLWADTETRKRLLIAYSSKDSEIAQRLESDLQSNGIRCWLAPEAQVITGGVDTPTTIEEAIKDNYKILLIVSENSINSDWIEREIDIMLKGEKIRKRPVLFPIKLDSNSVDSEVPWVKSIKSTKRYIGDFQNWNDEEAYDRSLTLLLRDILEESRVLK